MDSSDRPEIGPAPTHYAQGDTSKGYDLKSRIVACLNVRFPGLRGIRVTVFGNTADLRGEVRSLQEKRLCVECCRHVPGVTRVVDDLTLTEQTPVYLDPEEELS